MSFFEPAFPELPVVGILRGFEAEQTGQIVQAALRGGLKHLEITMNTPGAAGQIRAAVSLAEGRMRIGAGTVTTMKLLEEALEAGATFIVTPSLQIELVRACVERKVAVFPGAFTPTEIVQAWEAGATMVKLFPAEAAGPGYIKSIKAPLPQVRIMPTGGVDLGTIGAFIKAGADGFGVGSPLFNKARIEAGDWGWVEERCRAFAQAARRCEAATESRGGGRPGK